MWGGGGEGGGGGGGAFFLRVREDNGLFSQGRGAF